MKISVVATSLVTLVVAVIVIALIAVPVVEDASKGTPYSSENTGYDARYTLLSNPTFSLSVQGGVATMTIDGNAEVIPLNAQAPIVMSDGLAVRVSSGGVTYYDLTNDTWSSLTNPDTAWLLEVTAGSWTITRGSSTAATGTMTDCFVRTSSGTLGLFMDGSPKITLGQTYYIGGFFNGTTAGPFRLYSAVDGMVSTAKVGPFNWATVDGQHVITENWTVTSKITYDEIGGNQAVGYVEGITWTWTNGTTSGSETTTVIIADIEYTSTPLGTGGDTNSVLLSIIPIMLIIVAIMVAVRIIRDA